MKWCVSFLIGFLIFSTWPLAFAAGPAPEFQTVEPEKQPFWRKKEKLWHRLLEQREVVVAVKTQSSQIAGFKEELYMQGAGIVDAPLARTYAVAQRFDSYPKMSRFVKSAAYNPETKTLTMHTSAFKYDAHLRMELRLLTPAIDRREIRFRVIEGAFRGLTGVVGFSELTPNRTEIALTAQMAFLHLPMPKFFVEFGLEVALRLLATNMRACVEKEGVL